MTKNTRIRDFGAAANVIAFVERLIGLRSLLRERERVDGHVADAPGRQVGRSVWRIDNRALDEKRLSQGECREPALRLEWCGFGDASHVYEATSVAGEHRRTSTLDRVKQLIDGPTAAPGFGLGLDRADDRVGVVLEGRVEKCVGCEDPDTTLGEGLTDVSLIEG